MYHYFVFADKSNIQETCLKIFIGRVLTEVIKETLYLKKILMVACRQLISAPNIYCYNFNGRAVPWVSPFEFSVRKSTAVCD